MKLKLKNKLFVSALCLYGILFSSCNKSYVVSSISDTELFNLDYGTFEDELNLFNLSGSGSVNTYMTMRDGFFYIANGESHKLMEFNSYGDLLSLYYNKDATKEPEFAVKNGQNSTKKAVEYPFNTLGPVTVDSKKCLYVVDTMPKERQEYDEENRLLLSNVILRFDSNGRYMDYLGQQGPGGTPLPFVKKVFTTKNNELVVVCATNTGSEVFWYNENGFLAFKVPLTSDTVPSIKSTNDIEVPRYISIENVVPDYEKYRLYVKVDYFTTYLDPSLKVQSGIDYEKTLLYPLDITTGRYEEPLDIPPYEESVSENLSKEVYYMPYDFMGVTESGWFFFMIPVDKGFIIQMVQPNGQRILKRSINVDHSEILFYSMNLSGNGIISSLFVKKDKAQICWWRTDSFIDSFINSN